MAEIVAVHATSHTPVMLNFPDAIDSADRDDIFSTFRQVGQQIRESAPQAVVVISDDHLHNFFLDNLPAFCIGAAREYAAPVEHWLKVDKHQLRGDAALGPAFSMRLTLDHGVLTPLHLAGVAHEVAVVPLLVNCVQPPLPTMARALAWGRMLGAALRSYHGCERVAVLATGGISHDVATPRMGMVNEAFDREFLQRLASGDDEGLVRFCADHVNEAGNGAEEIRTWLVAHGTAAGARFETLYYKAQPHWYTGIALARWCVGAAPQGARQVVAETIGDAP
jgi:aromatic ring-opening dioxygenase catalytic subunit (LigB family)